MNLFKVTVITPEGLVFEGQADSVSVPGTEGVIGALRRHTPLFAKIHQGEVIVKKGGITSHLSVASGFVDVGRDHVTILVDSAFRDEEMEEAKILEAKKRAEEKLKEKLSRTEYLRADAELRRLLIDLRVSRRRKNPKI